MGAVKYTDLMIDPPWPKRKGGRRTARPNQGRDLDYRTMSVPDIFSLLDSEILPQADSGSHNVWLWAIDGFLHEAERGMTERGYRLHARLVWDKGNGVAPAFTVRYSHEYLLWFYRPRLRPVAKGVRGTWRTVLAERARQHSRKPDIAYELVSALYPEGRRIDVFSREKRRGWDQWGDEVDLFSGSRRG